MKSAITFTDYEIIVKNPIGQNQMMKYENGSWVVKCESEWKRIILNKKLKKLNEINVEK